MSPPRKKSATGPKTDRAQVNGEAYIAKSSVRETLLGPADDAGRDPGVTRNEVEGKPAMARTAADPPPDIGQSGNAGKKFGAPHSGGVQCDAPVRPIVVRATVRTYPRRRAWGQARRAKSEIWGCEMAAIH